MIALELYYMKTTILYIPDGVLIEGESTMEDQIVAVRPAKWTDEQWAELVQMNQEYYDTELFEKEWTYGG